MDASPATRARPQAFRIAVRSVQMAEALCVAGGVFVAVWWRHRGTDRTLRALGRASLVLCTRLGATFIKVGQIVSTRSDLLPNPLVSELAALQDRVAPFPFETARAIVERELGAPLDDRFDGFEATPVAAASVAQVHRARWRETVEVVAVKIRRPDIAEKVALDRAILIFVARQLERFVPTLRLLALEEATESFCSAVEAQIDLRRELANNHRFQALFADDPDVRFPRPVDAGCAESVLTMEFVDGIPESRLAASGVDVRRLVQAGLRGVARMIFQHGFVHADLHPGNLRFEAPGRIYALDLGLVGEIEDRDRENLARLLFALATGDGRTVARIFAEESPHAAIRDYAAYERDIAQFVESVRRKGLGQLQLAVEIGRIFDILRRHRVQARAHMTMVNLAIMTAEGLSKRLAPELALAEEVLPYLAETLGLPVPSTARPA